MHAFITLSDATSYDKINLNQLLKFSTVDVFKFSEGGVQLKLKESNYIGKLAEMNIIRQFVYMNVEETGQVEAMFEDFILQKPHLEIVVRKCFTRVHYGMPFK